MRCQQPEQAGLLPFGDFMTDGLFIRGAGSNTKESAMCVCACVPFFAHLPANAVRRAGSGKSFRVPQPSSGALLCVALGYGARWASSALDKHTLFAARRHQHYPGSRHTHRQARCGQFGVMIDKIKKTL